jgi:ferredoxin-NADP reductase
VYFLCGPRAMIEAVEENCASSGVEKKDIRYERWW